MPTYISLLNFTDQGMGNNNIGNAIYEVDMITERAQQYDCTLQSYWTMGPYDIVLILEAPDDESATAVFLYAGSRGAVRTTTLRAHNREEMTRILGRLGY